MFLNDALNTIPLADSRNYIIFNFAKYSEPLIERFKNNYLVKWRYFRKFQSSLDGLKIIRTNNTSFTRFKKFLFDRENIYYSDLPYGYISILKNANLVFSDRVHTCACALIMGTKAMYIKSSKRAQDGRSNLFNRINAQSIFDQPTSLNFEFINDEKKKMERFLIDHFYG